jgi:hypothetical protein
MEAMPLKALAGGVAKVQADKFQSVANFGAYR